MAHHVLAAIRGCNCLSRKTASSPLSSSRHLPSRMGSDSEPDELSLFDEPEGFYQPDKEATSEAHQLLSGQVLNIRLVGHNPLWVRHHSGRGQALSSFRAVNMLTRSGPSSVECWQDYFVLLRRACEHSDPRKDRPRTRRGGRSTEPCLRPQRC